MKSSQLVFALVFLWTIASCHGQGTLILGHFESVDPTNEGFSLLRGGGPSLAPAMSDLGYDAWSVGVNAGTDIGQYHQSLTSEQANSLSGDWTLSLSLRVGQSVSPANSGIFTSITTGTEYFFLDFGALANGDPSLKVGGGPELDLNGTGSGYHNYQLAYNAAIDLASLWVDGTQSLTAIRGIANPSTASLVWGISQHASSSSYYANWNEVSLFATPEPSTCSLIVLGSGVLYCARKWKRFRI